MEARILLRTPSLKISSQEPAQPLLVLGTDHLVDEIDFSTSASLDSLGNLLGNTFKLPLAQLRAEVVHLFTCFLSDLEVSSEEHLLSAQLAALVTDEVVFHVNTGSST